MDSPRVDEFRDVRGGADIYTAEDHVEQLELYKTFFCKYSNIYHILFVRWVTVIPLDSTEFP